MPVITKKPLVEFWQKNARTEKELTKWYNIVVAAAWRNPADVKVTFGPLADFVQTNNGNPVIVFDAANNRCRLITAIHYLKNFPVKGRVYILRVLTHDEYDLEHWKDEL